MTFQVQNGSFGYPTGRRILHDISFEIHSGEVLAVLGSNGIGKTTLLKCMMGFLHWRSGESLLDGKNIALLSPGEIWRQIAYIPQAKAASFSFTGLEMATIGRSAHLGPFAQPSRKDIEIAEAAMREIGVLHLRDKPCSQMSGGELQMVLIARALATHPQMMILDEPESGLDFRNQLIILDLIDHLVHEKRLSAVINTHYPSHAMKVSDKTLMLCKDGSYCYGPTGEVINTDNMRKAFEVNVVINSVQIGGRSYEDMIPISVVPKNDSISIPS